MPYYPPASSGGSGLPTDGSGAMTGTITSTLGSITTNKPALSATATWNDSGVTFYGIFQNITVTAAAAASRLIDLQVGGSTKFNVDKDGLVTSVSNGSNNTGAFYAGFSTSDTIVKFGGNASYGLGMLNSNGAVVVVQAGAAQCYLGAGIVQKSTNKIMWTATGPDGTVDTGIVRNAAGVLEVNNATAGTYRDILVRSAIIDGAPSTAGAGQIAIGADTRTTIGANGGASALTALPVGYIDINVGGTGYQIPYYSRGA